MLEKNCCLQRAIPDQLMFFLPRNKGGLGNGVREIMGSEEPRSRHSQTDKSENEEETGILMASILTGIPSK